MARVTAPLLSFDSAGAIAKTQVYSNWRGIAYARRYVVPSNPKTTEQQYTRDVFSWLNSAWKFLNADVVSAWTTFAKGRPFTDRNAFISKNLAALRNPATDLSGMFASPGAGGGLAAASIATADATGHHATVTLGAPDLPVGWSIVKAAAVCWKQQDANSASFTESFYGSDNTSPYAVDVNCGAAGTFACFGYFVFTKPDGSTAYGISSYATVVLA